MLGLAGLAFAACGNEDEVGGNVTPEGNGAVSIKIVAPTVNSRAITGGSQGDEIQVTAESATVTLYAKFSDGDEFKTITLSQDEFATGAKFWNVTSKPTSVSVSMNGGAETYSDAIESDKMQATDKIPAYGEATEFTVSTTGTESPTADDIENGNAPGAKEGDENRKYFMYEADVTLKIPVARLEVSNIRHKQESLPTVCEYQTLTIDGVYMDNIRPTGIDALTDYYFPSDNGATKTGVSGSPLYDEILPGSNKANDFMNYTLSWPGENQVFAYNFYAPESAGDLDPAVVNPNFKIYFATATASNQNETKVQPRYAKIVNYKSAESGTPIVLLAGHVYRITDVQLEDKNIIGGEGGDEQWGVTVTVTEAAWQVQTIYADWAGTTTN